MANQFSFDIVSEVDLQEVRNAVDQAAREISQRFDFKGTGTSVALKGDKIEVHAGTEDRLVAAKSAAAGTVEIHDHINEGGIMKMRRVDGIKLSGEQTVTLKPGGYHLMLMDLKQPLKQGGKLPLTLVFEKAGEVAVEAVIAPIGAAGPSGETGAKSGHGAPSKASGGHKY